MNEEEVQELAKQCLSCKLKPCRKGCPLTNNITDFIKYIKEKEYKKSYECLLDTTVLQPICGRICPHNRQCQGSCIKGIKGNPVNIGKLEAFIGDMAIKRGWKLEKIEEKKDKKVAIIGGGPAGITASAYLAKRGFEVDIYEKHPKLGGLLTHGIPDFRLPRDIIDETIKKVLDLGIKIYLEKELGNNLSLEELEKEYDAILLAFGANISSKMKIQGEELDGVYGANELLENENYPDFSQKKVCVIGGGNTAMDTARTVNRKGAKEVTVIYRRAREQMPAEDEEIESAISEGVKFLFQNNIVKISGQDKVQAIECIRTELIKVEGDRERPVNIEGSNYKMDMDYVIMAIGAKPQKEILDQLKLEKTDRGYIKIDENQMTSRNKVFACGDLIGTEATVAWAARSGRNAAEKMYEFLEKNTILKDI